MKITYLLCACLFFVASCAPRAVPPPEECEWNKIKKMPYEKRPRCEVSYGTTDIALGAVWSVILFPIGLAWGIPQILYGVDNNEVSDLCREYNRKVFHYNDQ